MSIAIDNDAEKSMCDNCDKRHFSVCQSKPKKGGKWKGNFGFNKKEVAHIELMLAKKDH